MESIWVLPYMDPIWYGGRISCNIAPPGVFEIDSDAHEHEDGCNDVVMYQDRRRWS